MFHYTKHQILINKDDISLLEIENFSIDNKVEEFMTVFEKEVYQRLQKLDFFKYIQGDIRVNTLFEELKSSQEIENVLLITQHPGCSANVLVYDILQLRHDVIYLFFIGRPLNKFWLNSRIDYSCIYDALKKITTVASFQKSYDLRIIELNSSSKIQPYLINPKDKNALWKI